MSTELGIALDVIAVLSCAAFAAVVVPAAVHASRVGRCGIATAVQSSINLNTGYQPLKLLAMAIDTSSGVAISTPLTVTVGTSSSSPTPQRHEFRVAAVPVVRMDLHDDEGDGRDRSPVPARRSGSVSGVRAGSSSGTRIGAAIVGRRSASSGSLPVDGAAAGGPSGSAREVPHFLHIRGSEYDSNTRTRRASMPSPPAQRRAVGYPPALRE